MIDAGAVKEPGQNARVAEYWPGEIPPEGGTTNGEFAVCELLSRLLVYSEWIT